MIRGISGHFCHDSWLTPLRSDWLHELDNADIIYEWSKASEQTGNGENTKGENGRQGKEKEKVK